MSLRDYEISHEIERKADWGEDFYALVMVLMRNADTSNQAKLRAAWPEVWAELEQRYNAPAGLLVGERKVEDTADGCITTERRDDGIYINGQLVRAV